MNGDACSPRQPVLQERSPDALLPVPGTLRPMLMFDNLQGLRAYAALSVASFHFALIPAASVPWRFGSFGVDLFFVLSGFIIAYSTTRDPRRFLIHRAFRVLPSYWIVTSLGGLLALLSLPVAVALGWYGQSLLFLTGPEGRPPIIFVGWTIIYELAFYLVYAIVLRVGGRRAPLLAIVVLLILAYGVHAVGLSARTWPLLVEFTFGLAVFLTVERAGLKPVHGAWAALLVVAGLFTLYALEGLIHGRDGSIADQVRVVALGVPSAAVVLGLILLEQAGFALRSRFVLGLGAASYAIYLLHPLVFSFVLPLPAGSAGMRGAIFAVLLTATIAVSVPFHVGIETPLIRYLRRRLTSSNNADGWRRQR